MNRLLLIVLMAVVLSSSAAAIDYPTLMVEKEVSSFAIQANADEQMLRYAYQTLANAPTTNLKITAMGTVMQEQVGYQQSLERLAEAVARRVEAKGMVSGAAAEYRFQMAMRKVSFGLGLVRASQVVKSEMQESKDELVLITLFGVAISTSREAIRNLEAGIEEYSTFLH